MKQSVSPVVIGIVAFVAVLILGFFGYRAMAPAPQDPNPPTSGEQARRMKEEMGKYSPQAPGGPTSNSGGAGARYRQQQSGGGQQR